jgi:hypothetical protein
MVGLKGVFCKCIDCGHTITNPICPECLTKQMQIMLSEKDPSLMGDISPPKIGGETLCLSCGQEMGLCAHCFSRDIYEFLKAKNSPAAEDFLAKFDFSIRQLFVNNY